MIRFVYAGVYQKGLSVSKPLLGIALGFAEKTLPGRLAKSVDID